MRVSFEYNGYNRRRYNRPWGARVSFQGSRMTYDFDAANYLGDDNGGAVHIECEPGDIIASGQKDNTGKNTHRDLYIVQADGSAKLVDANEALQHWDSKDAVNPLAGISTEDLIAELQRRGVSV